MVRRSWIGWLCRLMMSPTGLCVRICVTEDGMAEHDGGGGLSSCTTIHAHMMGTGVREVRK